MSSDYWLGVVTIPIIIALGFAAIGLWVRVVVALRMRGITFEAKLKRYVDEISDYVLHHHIWWERAFGPIFVGGWYREQEQYMAPSRRLINRWIGFGSVNGPCLMVFRSKDLGDAP